ncbi:hypothetical protein AK812_SmicGene45722 [Symbiodinium microadriaticum]|uniref:Uncharacterized protein n=1 Tax=Symbiodinium microadriaticum TaxID=2951 RepID=A0A1Q9BVD6_SYMMI|nr:hypothetical protein AK812_SmicGene45722 [Symbiodinium microadriaticum]
MIYDEAMEVNVNGYSFLAFHKFELFQRDGLQQNISHCGETGLLLAVESAKTRSSCGHQLPDDEASQPPVELPEVAETILAARREDFSFVCNLSSSGWRYRIQHQNPSFDGFSFNFPLFCSEYNQGCNGGYAFLASRWAQDVGLVPKNCSCSIPFGKF